MQAFLVLIPHELINKINLTYEITGGVGKNAMINDYGEPYNFKRWWFYPDTNYRITINTLNDLTIKSLTINASIIDTDKHKDITSLAVISPDKKSFTLDVNEKNMYSQKLRLNVGDIIIEFNDGTTTNIPITTNITGCTMLPNVSEYVAGETLVLTITPLENKYFNGTPTATVTTAGIETNVNFNVVNNIASLDLATLTDITENSTITINATATNKTATVENVLTHCTIDPIITSYTAGDNVELFITPDKNYTMASAVLTVSNPDGATDYPFNEWGEHKELNLNTINFENGDTFTITGIATAGIVIPSYNLANCTITPAPESFNAGDSYPESYTIKANHGFIFSGEPSITLSNDGEVFDAEVTKISDYEYSFRLYNDYYETPYIVGRDDTFTVNGVAIAEETPIADKYGIINLYKPSSDNLRSLCSQRYKKQGNAGGVLYNDLDLGQYITSLKMIYCDIASGANENIVLGLTTTTVSSPTIENDEIILDLGNATIKGLYGNDLDITASDVSLILPFIDRVSIDSHLVMNKTINIKYDINIISGRCIANVYQVTDENPILIGKYNGVIGFDVPYSFYTMNGGDANISYNNMNAGETLFNVAPSIIVNEHKKADPNNKIYECYKVDTIANETGYFAVNNISLNIPATESELNEIENILKTGAII